MPAEVFLGIDKDGDYCVNTDLDDLLNDNSEIVQVIQIDVELPSRPLPVVRVRIENPQTDPIVVKVRPVPVKSSEEDVA